MPTIYIPKEHVDSYPFIATFLSFSDYNVQEEHVTYGASPVEESERL